MIERNRRYFFAKKFTKIVKRNTWEKWFPVASSEDRTVASGFFLGNSNRQSWRSKEPELLSRWGWHCRVIESMYTRSGPARPGSIAHRDHQPRQSIGHPRADHPYQTDAIGRWAEPRPSFDLAWPVRELLCFKLAVTGARSCSYRWPLGNFTLQPCCVFFFALLLLPWIIYSKLFFHDW